MDVNFSNNTNNKIKGLEIYSWVMLSETLIHRNYFQSCPLFKFNLFLMHEINLSIYFRYWKCISLEGSKILDLSDGFNNPTQTSSIKGSISINSLIYF